MAEFPQQICPAPSCGVPIYEYRREESPDTLDLFCPDCGEHVAHLNRETLVQLAEEQERKDL